MTMTVRRLSNSLGAEVIGADLRRLGEGDFELIQRAWREHLLLVFRDQKLDYPAYIAFGQRFGELERYLHGNKDSTHPDYPEIYFITNREVNGKPSETREIGREWHTDQSYTVRPLKATMLYCREIPECGGDTMFTNMHLAYDRLSPRLQKVLDELEAVQAIHNLKARYAELGLRSLQPEQLQSVSVLEHEYEGTERGAHAQEMEPVAPGKEPSCARDSRWRSSVLRTSVSRVC